MTEGNKKTAQFKKHTAAWNGTKHSLSTTDWCRMLDIPITQVERGIKKHGSMQNYIDLCHKKTQCIKKLTNNFLYRAQGR